MHKRNQQADTPSIRKLGATEQLFWLIDRNRPIHFTLVAQIDRVFAPQAWDAALSAVQQRHPLLSARILTSADAAPAFHHDANARIPLRLVDDAHGSLWQSEVRREMAMPVDGTSAPLVRATVLQGDGHSTIVLTAHHALLDGMGGAYVMEDLLRALSGSVLEHLPLVQSLESLLGTQMQTATTSAEMTPAPEPKAFRAALGAHPEVATLALDAHLTQTVVERSRKERTTVHGAVAAAVHEAGRRLSPVWCARPIRTVTPIDLRKTVDGVGKANGIYIAQTITIDDRERGAPFWHAAREIKALIAPAQMHESVARETRSLDAFMASNPSVDDAAGFLSHMLAFDVLLSNLGSEPIISIYEDFALKALWGPFVSSGFADDQVIGVCTLGGVLRLAHTSYDAMPGLLEEVCAILSEAVAA
jgi:NRPS condensation-like uncharacterized protein